MPGFTAISLAMNERAIDDPYLWLEEIEGQRALEWVKAHNELTKARYGKSELFQDIYRRTLATLDSDEKLAYPRMMGDLVYNFWRDGTHKRGILRRASLSSFLAGKVSWQNVLSIDELAEKEGENWVYAGDQALPPDYKRTLLQLSRGGSDAVVVREFDLERKEFVEDGFYLPEAKSDLAWKDRDTLYVGSDFGPGTLTESGYPRQLKLWKRGTSIDQASLLFEAQKSDLSVGVWVVRRLDENRDFIVRAIDFWNDEKFEVVDGKLHRLDIPSDVSICGVFQGQILLSLRSDWVLQDRTYAKGSVVSLGLDALVQEKEQQPAVLFDAARGGTFEGAYAVASCVLVSISKNVQTELCRYELRQSEWVGEPIPFRPGGSAQLVNTSRVRDDFFATQENLLDPTSLYFCSKGAIPSLISSLPNRFDASDMECRQYWACSRDGTKVPYYLVGKKEVLAGGNAPTLLYGYGGFEVSLLPGYLSLIGPAWLERGGLYASANIRGGGEFGPAWHQAALRENRFRAFEDFEAVAEDLVRRGITTSAHLGIHGRSNGGLLMGAMLTRRPELFKAVLVGVPLLDMARYNKLLAGASWVAEYGDPDKPADWDFIKAYSPYHNLHGDRSYPVPLIFTSTKDDRVHPGHARKMAARMEEMGFEVIYYENTEGGHAGAADNAQTAFFTALNYSYLWDRLS